jgi:hypothetical protein
LLELLATSLDLPKRHLQGPDLFLGILQIIVELLLMLAEVYKYTTKWILNTKTSTL